jgi:superfamily II DNA or RNA helicase/HKD family nuclease
VRPGLYEELLTRQIELTLDATPELEREIASVDDAEQPHVLARHLASALVRRLRLERTPEARVKLVNDVLELLALDSVSAVSEGPRQLLSLSAPAGPGVVTTVKTRPATPLSDAALLTNASGEPALASELRAEMASAAHVDLLCAFVKWHGLRLLEDELRLARGRGTVVRVITTTYMGATERAALDRLVKEFGAEVRVQYDAQRTRLHAKAWLFRRETGFDTAYVGSSNLSRAALLDGVEWNVRLSSVATPDLLDKFSVTFDTYWADPSYESYNPDRDRDRIDDALALASGRMGRDQSDDSTISNLDVVPRHYQESMLEALDAERSVHGRHRNLLVAATGTGKTVVAALDYRRLAHPLAHRGEPPSLLFVAHRAEILRQSRRTFREVLKDRTFGELYVAGSRPERWKHIFASVQSLSAYGVDQIPADAFDVVIMDEFHHAEAPTYRRLLDHLRPKELLGLTATPERADGTDVRVSFFGGRSAYELRLWDALAAEILSPFHYFGIADEVDLSRVEWKRGRYDEAQLSDLFTGNDARARLALSQLRDKVIDVRAMRGLGFCVSVAHAQYMARVFEAAGIPSLAVSGDTPQPERQGAIDRLRRREVNVIFSADLFNEGVDIPEVDTVLFLRPTESSTLFLQQLGRGLRLAEGKAVLTVLDFVGHHRKEFRFDQRYRSLTGYTRRELERQVEKGFPFLPSGCQIVLEKQVSEEVLRSVREQLQGRWRHLVAELRAHPTASLREFVDESGADVADIVSGDRSWTSLKQAAAVDVAPSSAVEAALLKRVRTLAHVDDRERASAYLRLLEDRAPRYSELDPNLQAFARMLFFSLWPGGGPETYEAGLESLRSEVNFRADLREVIQLSMARAWHVARPLTGALAHLPLRVHARYTREEVLSGLQYVDIDGRKPNSFREGVLYADAIKSDALFVTLKKSESDYSPTTMYRDYAISPDIFHWESQSVTRVQSPTGQRYLRHRELGTHVLLFSRPTRTTEFGTGAPFVFLGSAQYVTHKGERPIAITWRLDQPMPADIFAEASVVA